MSGKVYKYIKNKFSVVETEVWDFINDETRTVDPTLAKGHYRYGIALYMVPSGFCSIDI